MPVMPGCGNIAAKAIAHVLMTAVEYAPLGLVMPEVSEEVAALEYVLDVNPWIL